jgi:hypothetical protein
VGLLPRKRVRKSKILNNVHKDFYFSLIDGSSIKNLLELVNALDKMSDDVFYYHVTPEKNDFANWIRDVFKEKNLAEEITKVNSRLETEVCLLKYLVKELSKGYNILT